MSSSDSGPAHWIEQSRSGPWARGHGAADSCGLGVGHLNPQVPDDVREFLRRFAGPEN
jgi:hypothetical protein